MTAEQIAAGLTKAQREALLAWTAPPYHFDNAPYAGSHRRAGQAMAGLEKRGLACRGAEAMWHINDTAIEVRALLTKGPSA